jgi:hypothetical protein
MRLSTAVTMKSTIFWDAIPCSPIEVNQHFGGIIACIFRIED